LELEGVSNQPSPTNSGEALGILECQTNLEGVKEGVIPNNNGV